MTTTVTVNREVVGLFEDRPSFEAVVHHLLQVGFTRTDLSVLDSHVSLAAAGAPAVLWKDTLTALVGEIKYEGPLVAVGVILLAGGPTAALIAGLIGAATAGVAAKEVLDEVTSAPDSADFTNALAAGGLILWINCATPAQEQQALKLLQQFGAGNVHVHERSS